MKNFRKSIKFFLLSFSFAFCLLPFTFICYASNLDEAKIYFLKGDYKSAILEGEKILSQTDYGSLGLDELYYILGLSYLKDANYLRACDIFEIILKEFKNSDFKDEAKLGLADAYFLRGNFDKAKIYYQELIEDNPRTELKAQVYSRLSQIAFKKEDTQQGKEYLDKLKTDFPLNLESRIDLPSDFYYTVQVGSFTNINNARNLAQKLVQKDYPAYIEEAVSQGQKIYRVRVGKFSSRSQAQELENRLFQEGYPTKIFP